MFEEQGVETLVENEELQEKVKEKDTHRKRRKEKEKEKQKEMWKQKKPRGKRMSFRNRWDDDDEEYDF